MSRNFTDNDYELLSAYLDGEVSDQERRTLEARLQAEPDLQRELQTLRQTVSLIRALPVLAAPRNFTLDARVIRPSRFQVVYTAFSAVAAAMFILAGSYLLLSNVQQPALPQPQVAFYATVLPEDAVPMQGAMPETAASMGLESLPTQTHDQAGGTMPAQATAAPDEAGSDATGDAALSMAAPASAEIQPLIEEESTGDDLFLEDGAAMQRMVPLMDGADIMPSAAPTPKIDPAPAQDYTLIGGALLAAGLLLTLWLLYRWRKPA